MAIGFKGKYFTLAAITATVSASLLSAEALAINETIFVSKNAKEKEAQELDEESPTVVISKKIKPKKVDFFSANKTPTISTNLTDNIKIITSEELKLKGVSTLHEALSLEVFSTNLGGTGQTSQIYLQGMSHKYTHFLIDGIRINDPAGTSGANIDHILLDDVERIEIIKGAQSGVWGADAVSGVINIITKDPTLGIGANVGLEMGRYGHLHGTSGLSYAGKNSGIGVSVSRLLKDGPSTMSKKGESLKGLEDDPYRNTTVNITGYHWLNTDNKIRFQYRDINSFTHYDGGSSSDKDQSSYEEKGSNLTWDYYRESHNITTSIFRTDLKREYFSNYGDSEFKGKSTGIEIKDAWRYDLDGSIIFGFSYKKDSSEEKNLKEDYKNTGIFANNTYRFNTPNEYLNRLVLTQALRYDHYKPSVSENYNKTTGKIGARYDLTSDISVYINFGTAFRAPFLTEMINSEKLDPEKAKNYNVGIDFWQFNVNFFQNEVKNMIDGWWDPVTWDFGYKNVPGKTKTKGVEVSYSDVWTDYLLGGGSFTYIDAKDVKKERLERRPLYQATGFVTYVPIKDIKLTGIGKYIGSRIDEDYSDYLNPKEVQTGKYFIADFRASYDIDKNWEVYARVDNVLDKEYQEVYGYTSLGRSFYAGFNWKF